MKISRATFGRIIKEARHKIAEDILKGKALKIEQNIDGKGECNESMFPGSER